MLSYKAARHLITAINQMTERINAGSQAPSQSAHASQS
jgi:hypothetical protein